ncbi:MAG: transporter substrate-binding protein [Nocardioidaceae bacterium]|nr:transporter substrate-binding protein [Nocardioidaceae bacterium]
MRRLVYAAGAVPLLLALVLGALLSGLVTSSPARAADPGPVVRVGTEGTYPPFSYVDSGTGKLTGYDIEVIEAVAKKAGWTLQFTQAPFDSIFPALDANRIDVVANQVSINPEREAQYLFTAPYTYSHGVIVTAKGNTSIKTLADLKGKTTAQSLTSNWAEVAKKAGANVQAVEGFAQAAELLKQGRVDAIVNDNIAVLDYQQSTGSTDVKIAGNAGDDVSKQAFAFRKSDGALRDQADKALAALAKDGTLAKISKSYFGKDVSVDNDARVTVKKRQSRTTLDVLRETAWPMVRGTILGTIPITAISFGIGLVLALAAALARLSGSRVLGGVARVYVSVIRGTPLLVQLFIVFFGFPEIGIKLPGFVAACLALSLNVGGYGAEIIRSSILSVPRGQFEAATTIGMGYAQSLRRIVLPQALRIAVPPLSNTLLSLVKDTSLVSVVLVTELFREAQNAASVSNKFLALYMFAALYYWVICFLLSLVQDRLEHRLERFAV